MIHPSFWKNDCWLFEVGTQRVLTPGPDLKSQNVDYMLAPLRTQVHLPQALHHACPESLWGFKILWHMSSRWVTPALKGKRP